MFASLHVTTCSNPHNVAFSNSVVDSFTVSPGGRSYLQVQVSNLGLTVSS